MEMDESVDFAPDEVFEFDTLDALDTLTPFRLQILGCFRSPSTVRSASEVLGVPRTRLYRHIHRLVDYGFLVEVDRRPKGRTTEVIYCVSARTVRPSDAFYDRYGSSGDVELMRLGFRSVEAEAMAIAAADRQAWQNDDRGAFSFARLHLEEDELEELVGTLRSLFASYGGGSGPLTVSFLASAIIVDDRTNAGTTP